MTKQTKILISVVLSCTLLLLLFIPSFAQDELDELVLIESGTYIWNDELVVTDEVGYLINFVSNSQDFSIFEAYPAFDNEPNVLVYATSADDFTIVYSGGWLNTAYKVVTIPDDIYVPYDVASFLDSNWQPYPEFGGNPFVYIMELVIEALDVPIFGTFSVWDMLTTVCGLFAVVWLLKLLAGG